MSFYIFVYVTFKDSFFLVAVVCKNVLDESHKVSVFDV